ncbi:MAG: class I SAM-dependent methyltransferase [Alphaproteobacteria bacterium]|nr:MAG: class I SAM-dependent methyltransferase [Alphaproteobacteria bacterium]
MKRTEVAQYWEANAQTWTRHVRAGYDIYRDGLNTPAFLGMLPPVHALCGLDIGCGEGSNTRELARLGARMHAIDVAPTFIRHASEAERAEPLGVTYLVADGTDLPFASGSFDFATAFMSMMDMADQGRALCEAARVLRPGGFLQFSILHPCFVPPHRRVLRNPDRTTRAIEVAGYFDATDGRIDTFWLTNVPQEERDKTEPLRVPRFHRTLGGWVDLIVEAGLVIERFGEPFVTLEIAQAEPALEDTRVAPIFLHVRAMKPKMPIL